jgi:hypothetical protein
VRAYVFLAGGASEPFSGFVWPTPADGEPGAWVDASAAPKEALRAYPARYLPYWLDDELWRTELTGRLTRRDHLLLPERARLVRRIDAWADPIASEFVIECARRVAQEAVRALRAEGRTDAATRLDEASDVQNLEVAAVHAADLSTAGTLAGYVADVCFYARDAGVPARAAGVAAKMSAYALAGDRKDAGERLARERAWQAVWLVDRLGLDEADIGDRLSEDEPSIGR